MKRLLVFLILYLFNLPFAYAKTINVYCDEKESFLEDMETNEKIYSPHYFPIAYWEFSINENTRELILKHKQKTFINPKYKIINPSEYFMLAQMDNDGNFVGSVSGGCVEAKVIEECISLIKNKKDCKKIDFKVSNENAWEVGLACGGDISIYIEEVV